MKAKFLYGFVLSICMILVMSSSLYAQEKFEGKVKIKISDGENAQDLDYFVKDNKFRFEVEGDNEGFLLMDGSSAKMFVVMASEKMYMEIPTKEIANSIKVNNETDEDKVQKTGETKDINGYSCEKWIYNSDEGTTESWLTKDLGGFMFMNNPLEGDKKASWQSEIETSGFFPMLVVHRSPTGKEESRYEVTSVEKLSLPAEMFNPPANFQKMEMPGFDLDMFK